MTSLSGLVTTSLTADKKVTEDFLWTTGDNPFAYTNPYGVHPSSFQIDTMKRNYIINALQHLITNYNEVVNYYSNVKTSILIYPD